MRIALGVWSALVAAACTFPDVTIDPNACGTDDECLDPAAPLCRDSRCVTCRTDADCAATSEGARCAPDGSCVSCLSNSDCDNGTCDVATGSCLECVSDDDCAGQQCDDGLCVECVDDGNCDGDTCFENRCVECVEDTDCSPLYCLEERCVECIVGETDCGTGRSCVAELNECAPDHCNDKTEGPGETGLDCGEECPPCPNGQPCLADTDCASNVCDDEVCQACTNSNDCPPERYCDGTACLPLEPLGGVCGQTEDACVDGTVCIDGICCESECAGACQKCTEPETGKPNGQCAQALPGTRCLTLNLAAGECTRSGVCWLTLGL